MACVASASAMAPQGPDGVEALWPCASEWSGFQSDGGGPPGGVHARHGRSVEDAALRRYKGRRIGGPQIHGKALAEYGLFFLIEGG